LNALAFGDHPYGSSLDGTIDSVTALTRNDILAANRAVLDKSRAFVSVVGDITPADAAAMVDSLLGDLPSDGPALPADVPFGLTGGTTVVPFDTPQSVALFAQRGIKRDDPDFFAAYVLNTIIGGRGPESRLMSEVREKRGLTYGVGTYLVPKDHTEYLAGSVASANDKMAEAIAVIRAQWADLAANGVTQAELDAAKTYITGEYPLRFDGNGDIADIMVGMQMIGLTPAYVVDRNTFIEAVTLEDVNRVAKELLDPAGLHFVVVGQPVGVESN
jgi:zinc protease